MKIYKNAVTLLVYTVLIGCAAYGFDGDADSVRIAKTSYMSTFDTAEKANEHCAQYKRIAKLEKEADNLTFPYADLYLCVDP